jgi:hypothetical protein
MSWQRARNLRLSIFVWPGRSVGRQTEYMMESCLGSTSHNQTVNTSKKALFLPAVTTVMIPCMCGQGSTVTALENSRRRKVRTALLWVITYTHTHTRALHTQGRAHHATSANTTVRSTTEVITTVAPSYGRARAKTVQRRRNSP